MNLMFHHSIRNLSIFFKVIPLSNPFVAMSSNYSVDLSAMRQPYKEDKEALLEKDLPSRDPIKLFEFWFQEAKQSGKIAEPNAVCVSTCTLDGYPSSRMVLLKGFGSDGFKFFTNMDSRKGQELRENPKAAMLFYWDPFNRQVRIEGNIEQVPDEEAKNYFEKRPKRSQIAAAISEQSKPILNRDALITKYTELEMKHAEDSFIVKPENWGGFKLIPKSFEFWQGQSSRLHDRIVFTKSIPDIKDVPYTEAENGWLMYRLQP
ncbi:pyridoxine-5'-phosphate oxidase [Tetranychus urticae]|uniref:pyridoxal 5'-phosphate synthase n=1 Tax=Tetranychus urticae TaxID=32264 RepID=T1JX70_TETUR|nr:pyridoxine-5'-phosphate oxidase [Tetranychus urticae]